MPAETQLGIVAMILSGAFDKLPRNCAFASRMAAEVSHFCWAAWIMRGSIIRWRAASVNMPPSQYLNRFSVDSAVFDQRALQFLVGHDGRRRVMLGSDYPFPLGEERVGNVDSRRAISARQAKTKHAGRECDSVSGISEPQEPGQARTDSSEQCRSSRKAGQLTYSSYLKVPSYWHCSNRNRLRTP